MIEFSYCDVECIVGYQRCRLRKLRISKIVFHDFDKHGKLDYNYDCAWYNKTADFIKDTKIEAAFMSTNSICQGE